MNSTHKSRSRSPHRPARYALSAVAAVAALGLTLVGCGGKGSGATDEGKNQTPKSIGTKVLWLGDSIAGAEAPALGAALKASGVEFKDSSSDGGGTIVDGGEEITRMISGDTWKQLTKDIEAFRPTVVAYQVTTYDWGSQDQQRAAYRKVVDTAKGAGAKVVFVSSPPIKIDGFYKQHEAQLRTASKVASEVAGRSGGTAAFFDASQVWGTDASAGKAQRAADGVHNCQQGAAAFAKWFAGKLGAQERFKPASVDTWAQKSWTGNERYSKLRCAA
ncbi:SGNH/GDSL hydrolase family protein [Streptomyces sp. NBC_01283]|uniref:SGNH/GDSL hydrolase family protein n=1 Tax=Streptomyces sp. NBC_01283 TaxID=2903812 RepID=UPI00352F65FA|nr:SGNH/GDSL hydrolase family protein [Streptomyces sp. NBC_01283]